MCKSCRMIHGRSSDAVYPFMVMYKLTGEKKYLDAANSVFDFGENMLNSDGSVYNDSNSAWRGITVFAATALCEAYEVGKDFLTEEQREKFLARLRGMADWLYYKLEKLSSNINYCATNTIALALCGKLFGKDEYLKKASDLAEYCMTMFSENGLLRGEGGHDHSAVSKKGCYPVDIGYNLEESMPSLIKYAKLVGNREMLDKLTEHLEKCATFILPDGGMDNSFGMRNNKWTYWGSRTSDGCCNAFLILADRNPAFAEAAYRNAELIKRCTHGGLLYGGPHYTKRGEYPCTHHTFEHANAMAYAVMHIDEAYLAPKECRIPTDKSHFKYYPEIDTYRFSNESFLCDITAFDFKILPLSKHATGGTMTLLWSYERGPMIAGSVTDYMLAEPHNQQLCHDIENHRTLLPQLCTEIDGARYSTFYFTEAEMTAEALGDDLVVKAKTGLADNKLDPLKDYDAEIEYKLTKSKVVFTIKCKNDCKYVLPLISGNANALSGKLEKTEKIFLLTGGFEAVEYTFLPDDDGVIAIEITN